MGAFRYCVNHVMSSNKGDQVKGMTGLVQGSISFMKTLKMNVESLIHQFLILVI